MTSQQQDQDPNYIPEDHHHQNNNNNNNNNPHYDQNEIIVQAEQLEDQDGNQANKDLLEDGTNPPSRRHITLIILGILAFAMYMSSVFEPFVATNTGKDGYEITFWDLCDYNATTDRRRNCRNPATSSGVFCDSSMALINAGRAFMIISLVSTICIVAVATSAFLGSAWAAQNFKVLSWVSCFCGLFFGIIYLAIQVGFSTRKVCDTWSESMLDSNGGDTYRVGPAIGFTVVGIVLAFIAQVIAAIGNNECLDAFVENRECCDDGSNGGRGSRRRAM